MPPFSWGTSKWGLRRWHEAGPAGVPWEKAFTWDFPGREPGIAPTIEIPSAGGGFVFVTLTPNNDIPYRIETRATDGTMVGYVEKWWDGFFEERSGEIATLLFKLEYDNVAVIDLVASRRVWLRDRYGLIIARFRIEKIVPTQRGNVRFVQYQCVDVLADLAHQVVTSYTSTVFEFGFSVNLFAGGVIFDLLGFQQGTYQVGGSRIENQIAFQNIPFNAGAGGSILKMLRKFQALMPQALAGHMWIDADNNFNWKTQRAFQGQELSTSANLQGVEAEQLEDEVITGLALYGEGQDPLTRLNLTDTGEATEIRFSDNFDEDDPRIAHIVQPAIKDADALDAAADRILEENDTVKIRYLVQVMNLQYAANSRLLRWDDIYMGSQMRLEASEIGVGAYVKVRRTRRFLDIPLDIEVELDNRRRTLANLLADLLDSVDATLDVNDDASRYPTVSRIFDGTEEGADDTPILEYVGGDWRYRSGSPGDMAYRDSNTWKLIAPVYLAANEAALPNSNIESYAMGRTADGESFFRNANNDGWRRAENVWLPRP